MRLYAGIIYAIILFFSLTACYKIKGSFAGGDTLNTERRIEASDIALLQGYKIQLVASGLTYPTGATFDDDGNLYVVESGYSYGEDFLLPRLLKINYDGSFNIVAEGSNNGPWTGVVYNGNFFYVVEGGVLEGGRILKIHFEGKMEVLVDGLPSFGDHQTNGPAIKDGYLYFGQGTATNSGVVGLDNYEFGWLKRRPDFHDIPCADIILNDYCFTTENRLTEIRNDKAKTSAFAAFNTIHPSGQFIKGDVPCSGAVMRLPISGGKLELVAWGFRNPFGLSFSPEGVLYVTDNGYDKRGSRQITGAGDLLWKVDSGIWYGWPDYSGSILISSDYYSHRGKELSSLILNHPNIPPDPVASLQVHSSSNGFEFSRSEDFGFVGNAFIAQFGDFAPEVGKLYSPVGYKVVRVDVNTGVINDFIANKGKVNGPASRLNKGGLERPVDIQFSPDGKSMYIVDFGILQPSRAGLLPVKKTGVIWKVTKG